MLKLRNLFIFRNNTGQNSSSLPFCACLNSRVSCGVFHPSSEDTSYWPLARIISGYPLPAAALTSLHNKLKSREMNIPAWPSSPPEPPRLLWLVGARWCRCCSCHSLVPLLSILLPASLYFTLSLPFLLPITPQVFVHQNRKLPAECLSALRNDTIPAEELKDGFGSGFGQLGNRYLFIAWLSSMFSSFL